MILQLSKIVQRELRMMSVWIPPLPYVTAVVGFCLALFNTHEFIVYAVCVLKDKDQLIGT